MNSGLNSQGTTAKRSIIGDFMKALAVVIVSAVVIAPIVGNYASGIYVDAELTTKADAQIVQLKKIVQSPLWDYNQKEIDIVGAAFLQQDIIEYLKIEDAGGSVMFEGGTRIDAPLQSRTGFVEHNGQVIGSVTFHVSRDYEKSLKFDFIVFYLLSVTAIMAIVLLFAGVFLKRQLGFSINRFGDDVRNFAAGDDSALRDNAIYKEFDLLVGVLQDMKGTISQQLSQLTRMNAELECRVNERTRDLAKQKEVAENYLAIASTIIVALDKLGTVTLINDKGCELLGYGKDEIIGRNWFDLAIAEDIRSDMKAAFAMLVSGDIVPFEQFENEIVTRSGERRLVSWHNSLLWGEHASIIGALSAGQDVTDERRAQEQLIQSSKMATLGEMATGIAHELNQPLSIIQMAANNIQRRIQDDRLETAYLADKLDKIVAQVMRASTIIDHMRIFGRKSDIVKSPLQPKQVVADALSLMSEQLRLSSIEVVTDIEPDLGRFLGHQVQIEQVLLNLLGNARDVLRDLPDDQLRRITIRAHADANNRNIVIEVEDTGGGISDDVLPKVFEPFFTTKEVGKGTGLGLSISYGIIAEMGGRIRAENKDLGACFIIELPLA